MAVSEPLAGKVILPGGVCDLDDVPFPGVTGDAAEVLLKVRVANLAADPDLADTAQRLICYYDTLPGLPLPASPGDVEFQISNLADKAFRV